MRVAFVGDWHGDVSWAGLIMRNLKREKVDAIIHVGDLAVLWDTPNPNSCDLSLLINSFEVPFYFIDGNHDNHDNLQNLKDNNILPYLTYMPRGSTMVLGGAKIGFLGGAYSIDKKYRVEGVSWWSNEEPTMGEAYNLTDKLDILVTHDAPLGANVKKHFTLPMEMELESQRTRALIQNVMEHTSPDMLFCGHWHQYHKEKVNDTHVTVLNMNRKTDNYEIIDI